MRVLLFTVAMFWPGALAPASAPVHEEMAPVLHSSPTYCENVERAYKDSVKSDRANYERQAREYQRKREVSLWASVNTPPAPAFNAIKHASGSTKFLMKAMFYCANEGS